MLLTSIPLLGVRAWTLAFGMWLGWGMLLLNMSRLYLVRHRSTRRFSATSLWRSTVQDRCHFDHDEDYWSAVLALYILGQYASSEEYDGVTGKNKINSTSKYVARYMNVLIVELIQWNVLQFINKRISHCRSFMSRLHQEFWDASLAGKHQFSTQPHWAKGTHPLSRWLAFYVAHQNPHRCRPHHRDAAILSLALLHQEKPPPIICNNLQIIWIIWIISDNEYNTLILLSNINKISIKF